MKSRLVILFVGFLVLWTALLVRAAVLQIVPNERLAKLEQRQFQTQVTLKSRRGAIVDRHGRDLALSTAAYSLYADPKILENKKALAKRLGKALGYAPAFVYDKIKSKNKRFVWLGRLLPADVTEEIKAWDIRGLQFVEEFNRIYPNENLAAQVLGFVGSEGQGLEGLEKTYDEHLDGNKKKVRVKRDARGRPLLVDGMLFTENPDGKEVKLTLDSELQYMLETELVQASQEFEADRAYGVILDAKTSAVLAMATSNEGKRNRAITDAFEPGSTMKTFVISAALREKIVQPNTRYKTEGGKFKVGNRIIREADSRHAWDSLTVSEILAYSSNVGTTKIAFDLGPQILRQALNDFGFGAKTGVDLPGDARGTLLPLPWHPHLMANISFGHGIAASPLQVANAYAAIANGGVLNQPFIVQSIRDSETGREDVFEPHEIRRVLSPEDAASMRLMLAGVTAPGGTGVSAKVDGFPVAGKTGTAQKVNPNGRGYLKGGYISSFAGFIPANDPRFVIFVAVDHPKRKNSYYGSEVAAPIFSRIASYAARKDGLVPILLSEKNLPLAPDKRRNVASKKIETVPEDKVDVAVKALSELAKPEEVQVPQELNVPGVQPVALVPQLEKLSAREVLRRLSGQDLEVRFRGTGVVSEIIPAPGTPIPDNKRLTVILK